MTRRSNPFEELERLMDRLNRQFDTDLGGVEDLDRMGGGIAVDVRDAGDEYVVSADLPGFDTDDIEVELHDDHLDVTADHEEDTAEEGDTYVRRERRHRSVARTVSLPGPVDEERVDASYKNGVLTVTLPKAEPDEGHSIEVE